MNSYLERLKIFEGQAAAMHGRSMIDPAVKRFHDEVMELLDDDGGFKDAPELISDNRFSGIRQALANVNANIHFHTEIELAKNFLTQSGEADAFKGSWINKGFGDLLRGQVASWRRSALFKENEGRPIAIVGGGAMPQTQVFLSQALGWEIASIERDAEAATLCREILQRIGLGHLPVIHADGREMNYTQFGLVAVATLVSDKSAVGARVADTAPRAMFSPRTAVRGHRIWREPVALDDLAKQGWRLDDWWEPTGSSVAALTFVQDRVKNVPSGNR